MKHLIIGTAGHIDHGKTALIKALTDIDCDTHKEEKQRGITINLGFSHLNLSNGESVGIIDVPGHHDFINTMVSGASGIDLVLLVIAADSGVMPQTIEHVNIITALGIKKGVVALTKTDLVDDDLLDLAKLEISEYLDKTSLAKSPIVGVSALAGKGLSELVRTIEGVIAEIDESEKSNLFRMYIDRLFTVKGFGSVVTGSVTGGSISAGQDVYLLPGDYQKYRVRSIERHGSPVETAIAGDRAAINLIGLKSEDFERGMLIAEKPIPATEMVDAYIQLFADAQGMATWSQVTFLSGTFECQTRMHLLNKDEVRPGEDGIVQLHLSKQAILMNKDKFILRNSSADATLGGGFIIDASPLHHKRKTTKLTQYLTQIVTNIVSDSSLKQLIAIELKKEFRPFTVLEIADKLNIPVAELVAEIGTAELTFIRYLSKEADILVDTGYDLSFGEKILNVLADHHLKNPLSSGGLDLIEINGKMGFSKLKHSKLYLEFLLQKKRESGEIDFHNNSWIIKGHKPKLDKKTAGELSWLDQLILNYGDEKPVLQEIEEKCLQQKIPQHKLKTYLGLMADGGSIRYFQGEFLHSIILDKVRISLLSRLAEAPEGIEIQEYKEIIGGTKRFRALAGDLLEAEKSIRFQRGEGVETRIFITEKGKKIIDDSLS